MGGVRATDLPNIWSEASNMNGYGLNDQSLILGKDRISAAVALPSF
jgi:hypothetical protein